MNRTALVILGTVLTAVRGGAQPPSGGPAEYGGYAFEDCGPTRQPAVRIVLLQGPVPPDIPAARPRPSIELLVNVGVERAAGQSIAVSLEASKTGSGATALSCPVVGSCTSAQDGSVSVTRAADRKTIAGEFRATWPGGQPRTGRFTAVWRNAGKACG
jgi:hypothetical protein